MNGNAVDRLTQASKNVNCRMPDLASYTDTTLVVALCQYGKVSPRMFTHLFRKFGSVASILEAERDELAGVEGLKQSKIDRITAVAAKVDEATVFIDKLKSREIQAVSLFDKSYPHQLEELNDPPPVLYFKGKLPDQTKQLVAVTGVEQASNPGMELTSQVVRKFAEADVQIVSSLAGGIDATAHLAAKASGTPSYAVIDCGVDRVKPGADVKVAIDIASSGGVISEYPPTGSAKKSTLKAANRLLAGLAQAVVVTEFYSDSRRTLDLLGFCRDIGKLAFVVIDAKASSLTEDSALSRAVSDGAVPIEGTDRVEDIIKSLV